MHLKGEKKEKENASKSVQYDEHTLSAISVTESINFPLQNASVHYSLSRSKDMMTEV